MPRKIASVKNANPSSENGMPMIEPANSMKRGHRRPSSNDSTVPDTAPTANRIAVPLAHRSPVLGPAQRLYQRLLADDVEDAVTLAHELVDARLPARASADERSAAVAGFYDEVAIPALRLATQQHLESATAEHRLRLSSGMD